ncbi:MAG: hypothetical protein JSS10_04600 [Verrucomicrobia bacterium]|nr:hypothetical protein [Verrucomicrobiota bacterium]
MLLTSFRSLLVEKTVILGRNSAKLLLISKQAEKDFKKIARKKNSSEAKIPDQPPDPSKAAKTKNKTPAYKEKRSLRYGLDSSKINLWPLLQGNDNSLSDALYKITIRLIQILYQDAEFYKSARDPKLAEKIVQAMLAKKGEKFKELFPEGPLANIYYKMLKGTNTGYPPLEEYFKIEKIEKKAPINWAYASTAVLQAVLGEETTQRILAAEKASWEENHRKRVLTKEKLRALLQSHPSPDFDINSLETVFSFDRKGKGLPHAYIEEKSKVMATR